MKEQFNQKLLVEGKDDQHVVWALCEKFKINQNFDVIDCEGIENLEEQIAVRLKQSGIETIGIIIDADTNLNSRWTSLSGKFSGLGYPMPRELPVNGLVIKKEGLCNLGIWIMPNNRTNGMIEDFISFLVPEEDKLLPAAKESLDKIETEKINNYKPIHKSKALIHTWLSWQEDPGTPLGLAITKRYLSTEKEICTTLVDWLNHTFN